MKDRNRVVYYSKQDLARGFELQKGEAIFRAETKPNYSDVNDILELYALKKYVEEGARLNTWNEADIKMRPTLKSIKKRLILMAR